MAIKALRRVLENMMKMEALKRFAEVELGRTVQESLSKIPRMLVSFYTAVVGRFSFLG